MEVYPPAWGPSNPLHKSNCESLIGPSFYCWFKVGFIITGTSFPLTKPGGAAIDYESKVCPVFVSVNVYSPILEFPISALVINPIAPLPNPAIYPSGGGPQFGFLNINFLGYIFYIK